MVLVTSGTALTFYFKRFDVTRAFQKKQICIICSGRKVSSTRMEYGVGGVLTVIHKKFMLQCLSLFDFIECCERLIFLKASRKLFIVMKSYFLQNL